MLRILHDLIPITARQVLERHHVGLVIDEMPTVLALKREVDDAIARNQLDVIGAYLESWRGRTVQNIPIAGGADTISYLLFGLSEEHYAPDAATDPRCVAAPNSCNYYGNLGRLTEFGPGVNNWDIGVMRRFRTTERQFVEFRFEMFNAFNHPNFDNPISDISNPLFGRTFSALEPRDLQFGLKFYW